MCIQPVARTELRILTKFQANGSAPWRLHREHYPKTSAAKQKKEEEKFT